MKSDLNSHGNYSALIAQNISLHTALIEFYQPGDDGSLFMFLFRDQINVCLGASTAGVLLRALTPVS
jgi:hypothetical protein